MAELLLRINKSFLRLGIFLKNLKIKAGYYPNASQLRLYAFGSPPPFTGEGLGERAEIPRNGHLPLSLTLSPEGRGDD